MKPTIVCPSLLDLSSPRKLNGQIDPGHLRERMMERE